MGEIQGILGQTIQKENSHKKQSLTTHHLSKVSHSTRMRQTDATVLNKNNASQP